MPEEYMPNYWSAYLMVTPHQQQLKHLLQLTKMRMLITELSEESMFPASETIDEKSSARAWTLS